MGVPRPYGFAPISLVPNLDSRVQTCSRAISTCGRLTGIDRNTNDRPSMGEKLDMWRLLVRRPHCHCPVRVTEVYDPGVRVLSHGCRGAKSGRDLGDEKAGRGVVVLEVSGMSDGREEVVVREEFHVRHVDVLFELAWSSALAAVSVGTYCISTPSRS